MQSIEKQIEKSIKSKPKQILFSRTSKITGKTIVGIVKYIDERHIISENGTLYELHEVEFNNKYIRQIKMKKLFIN